MLRDFIHSREFYDLMQAYRHTPPTELQAVVDAFEAVKAALVSRVEPEKDKAQVTMLQVTQPNGEPLPAPCAICGCHYDQLTAEIARLNARLAAYGQHKPDCEAEPHDYMGSLGPSGKPCTCGFDAKASDE